MRSELAGVFMAGDWVRQPFPLPQGLSQEKAYVTGIQVHERMVSARGNYVSFLTVHAGDGQ